MFFNIIIFILIFVVIVFIIKVYYESEKNKELSKKHYQKLNIVLKNETSKSYVISEKIALLESLHESLFKRLFKITQEVLLFQKLIFDSRS